MTAEDRSGDVELFEQSGEISLVSSDGVALGNRCCCKAA